MNTRYLIPAVFTLVIMSCVAVGQTQSQLFKEAKLATGYAYRQAITNLLAVQDAAEQLDDVLKNLPSDSADVRQARIILARLHYPNVFIEYAALIKKCRKDFPHGERPGFLADTILGFAKQGPENKYVDKKVGRKTWDVVGAATNRIKWGDAVYEKVEKYDDAEVQAGIARNAAARQAVLEHFLKFLDEGDPYEQSEVIDAVYRLWGSASIDRRKDEPLSDDIVASVYRDESRPLFVRYTAALWLPKEKQVDLQGFMLNVVNKSMSADVFQSEKLLSGALSRLESTADAATLAVLKSQTNGPEWKVQEIIRTTRKIETRLSKQGK